MKPSTSDAMRDLIAQVRRAIPFDMVVDACSDDCRGCSIKLIEFLDSELESWEYRLQQQQVPDFRDLSRLERSSRKIYNALKKNGLIDDQSDPDKGVLKP